MKKYLSILMICLGMSAVACQRGDLQNFERIFQWYAEAEYLAEEANIADNWDVVEAYYDGQREAYLDVLRLLYWKQMANMGY